jgi:tripartite-type tricarboxylate transporter receptor subunit TctC
VLEQPIIINNMPGAGTTIASAYVAKSAPDGYTLLLAGPGLYGSDQFLYKGVKYDGIKNFTAITRWSLAPMMLAVNKDLSVKNTQELVAYAKKNPDKVTYSSSGVGVVTHLVALEFEKATNTKLVHIPYKGGAPSLQALAAGDVQVSFGTPPSVMPLAQSGRFKVLAVTTQQRSPLFPDIPSMKDAGVKSLDFTFWFGLYGPAGLPADVSKKLFDASVIALNDPEVKARLEKSGNNASPSKSQNDFLMLSISEGRKSKELLEQSGAKVE